MCADENKISGGILYGVFLVFNRDQNDLASYVLMKIRSLGAYCMDYFLYF